MSADLSRRRFLSTASVATAGVAIPTTALALPHGGEAAALVNATLERLHVLDLEGIELMQAYSAAKAKLPWWAASGHIYIDREGSPHGPISNWPAVQGVAPPEVGYRQIRFSPRDLKERYERACNTWAFGKVIEERRAQFRAAYRKSMRELVVRLRAKRACERKVGLPAIEAALGANASQVFAGEDAIGSLMGAEPCVIAAKLLLVLDDHMGGQHDWVRSEDSSIAMPVGILRSLRPSLSGFVAHRVSEILAAPDDARFLDLACARKRDWPV